MSTFPICTNMPLLVETGALAVTADHLVQSAACLRIIRLPDLHIDKGPITGTRRLRLVESENQCHAV